LKQKETQLRWNDYLALGGAAIGALSLLRQRNWLLACAFGCLAAYTCFEKCFRTILPAHPDVVFPIAALCLVGAEFVNRAKRRKPQGPPVIR
jgi:hypothetical protein